MPHNKCEQSEEGDRRKKDIHTEVYIHIYCIAKIDEEPRGHNPEIEKCINKTEAANRTAARQTNYQQYVKLLCDEPTTKGHNSRVQSKITITQETGLNFTVI